MVYDHYLSIQKRERERFNMVAALAMVAVRRATVYRGPSSSDQEPIPLAPT